MLFFCVSIKIPYTDIRVRPKNTWIPSSNHLFLWHGKVALLERCPHCGTGKETRGKTSPYGRCKNLLSQSTAALNNKDGTEVSFSSLFYMYVFLLVPTLIQPPLTESILPAPLPKRTGRGPQQQGRLPAHWFARFLITRFLVASRAATEDLQAEGPPQSCRQSSDASSSSGFQMETEARALSRCHLGAYASRRMNCSSPFNHSH